MSEIRNTTPTTDIPQITAGDIADAFQAAARMVAAWDTAGMTAEDVANAITRQAAALMARKIDRRS